MQKPEFPIDFVMTWVDDSDPTWQESYRYYKALEGNETDGQSLIRFRNWDNLKYWFRGVEKYASWVNKIYFVTCGQRPEWLNVNHPQLVLVDHKDYIPEKYLPVFSSHPIELNLYRINGLSEHFVYFNDDIFITAPLDPECFWKNGKPREMAVEYPLYANQNDTFSHILLNLSRCMNQHFYKKDVIMANRTKWFYPAYGKYLLNNICMARFGTFSGIITPHFPSSLQKERMKEVWNVLYDELDQTCRHRFRSSDDINQYIFRFWNIATGQFQPINFDNFAYYASISDSKVNDVCRLIRSRTIKLICINDSSSINDFESVRSMVNCALSDLFPQQSSFEK